MILAGVSIQNIIDEETINKSEEALDSAERKIRETQKDIDEIKDDWNEIGTGIDRPTYTLTIKYMYENGGDALPTKTATYFAGETFNHKTPEISGYVPDVTNITNQMPATNVAYTVTYSADELADPSLPTNSWRRRWNTR